MDKKMWMMHAQDLKNDCQSLIIAIKNSNDLSPLNHNDYTDMTNMMKSLKAKFRVIS